MGLFSKKVDYDELYRKLSTEKMTGRELKKAEKLLDKLEDSGDRRGILWRPLISTQWKCADNASYYFSKAESKLGLCEEYIHIRSLPIVVNLFIEEYEYTPKPGDVIFSDVYRPHLRVVVFVARAYEHGWGVERNHGKAVEIIRETENYPKDGTFRLNSDLIKNAYKEITGTEFPDSESSKQKEKQAISDAAKNQNEQPQSDINFKRLELDGGDVYEGETRNGKRHGKGKYTWSDGSFYEGEWKDDRKDGNGKQSHPDGTCYDGGWKDDKMDGFGVLIYSNQSRYEGHWSEGTENGHGMLTFANGNSYDGEWKDGNENGHGIMKYINGDVYDGEWKDGDENGHGTMTFANGNSYDGEWKDGDMNGNGIYTYANGEKYKVTCKEGEIVTKAPFETPKTSADTAEDFEWEEFSSIGELHEKILHPELFCDPEDRYLRNSCMYLDTFVDEFREEFAGGDYAETKEIIAEILGVESGELTECIERRLDFIRGFTEKEYLLAAMYSLAYDERTDLAPYLANLACYLWTDTGDGDYFDPLLDLFRMSGEYDDDDSTWLCAILRLRENGNIDDPLNPNGNVSSDYQFADFDYVFGDLLDKGYLPGSDGKMYLSDIGDDSGDETEESDTGDNVLLRYQNGDSYRGAAVGGVREGSGAYFFADGGFYRGSFHANNYEGYGMLVEGNGRVYKGLWKNDKRCGYGEQTYANGEVYRGWWKDDRFHGFGRYEFLNGAVDLGEFYNNLHEGIFLIRREGQWFGCLWQNDEIVPEPTGPEVIDIGSDSRYTGEIVRRRNGNVITRVKHGYGKYRFSHRNGADTVDGYIGEFENDAPYGSGMVIHTVEDFLAVLISSDFRGEAMPEGECRMISLTTQGTTQYAEYYIGGFHDSKCRGKGMLSLLGNKNVCNFNWYGGLCSGSIISCDSFNNFPTGDITVVDEYGRRTQMHLNG